MTPSEPKLSGDSVKAAQGSKFDPSNPPSIKQVVIPRNKITKVKAKKFKIPLKLPVLEQDSATSMGTPYKQPKSLNSLFNLCEDDDDHPQQLPPLDSAEQLPHFNMLDVPNLCPNTAKTQTMLEDNSYFNATTSIQIKEHQTDAPIWPSDLRLIKRSNTVLKSSQESPRSSVLPNSVQMTPSKIGGKFDYKSCEK